MQASMMKLIFEIIGDHGNDNRFTMNVSQSESVPEIKERIQELTGIPISRQTLSFNGDILTDDFNFRYYKIVDGSTIHLHQQIDAEHPFQEDQDDEGPFQLRLDNVSIDFVLNNPDQTPLRIHTNVFGDDTVCEYLEGTVINGRVELLSEPSVEIRGGVRSKRVTEDTSEAANGNVTAHAGADNGGNGEDTPPPSTGNHPLTAYEMIRARNIRRQVRLPGPPSRTLMVTVLYCGQQTTVAVRPEEPVSALRGKLQQIESILPPRYEFIHNHRVMDETRSFAFNQVLPGDVIRPWPLSPY